MFDYIDHDNFLLYAAKMYDKKCANIEEFYEDLNRFKYLKKLITRYKETGILKERLILNHLIILNNVFGSEQLVKMLYLKLTDQMSVLKPFLLLLNIMPEKIFGITKNKITIITDIIPIDGNVVEILRKI